jgi:hypothetical protein
MKKLQILIVILIATMSGSAQKNDGWTSLFNGKNLKGWHQLNGKADYRVENGEIVGTTVANTENSFLATDKDYGDFILELDLLVDNGMNSGIQFRSLSTSDYKNGRVHGYQCEVDPSSRAWSAGIYDESRRGWLYPGDLNPLAKSAFKNGKWNHYRIECIGNSIRTWLNDVPVAYLIDDMTSSGFIALQVHSISKDEKPGKSIRWKNIQIKTTNLKPTVNANIFIVNLIPNILTPGEEAQGWKLLFDGKTTDGWKAVDAEGFPVEGWKIIDGTLMTMPNRPETPVKGVDIVTKEKYTAFEVQFEFNFAEGANSGVKYYVGNGGPGIGLEYQVLDDLRHPDAKLGAAGNRTMSSLYDLIPSDKRERFTKGANEWNWGRVVANPDNHIEHWLNGIKVVDYVRGSNIYKALVARSKYADYKDFGLVSETPVLLQYHQDQVKFRSIKIRRLK